MAKTKTIPVDLLKQLLDYNPETGELFWKTRPLEWFPNENFHKSWNSRFANKPALNVRHMHPKHRYCAGSLCGRTFRAHRVIWALVYGEWPDEVDHEDHDGFNNRLKNLVSGSHAENMRNQKRHFINSSGTCGVYWVERQKKWRASIRANGKPEHLGYFVQKVDAIAARKTAEIKHGYHPNHGS